MRLTADELHRRGLAAANARRFGAARRALSDASRRTDDPDLRARIAGTTAYVLGQVGEPAAAEHLCRDALASDGLRPETLAVLRGQLGALLAHAGRLDEADAMLGAALEVMEPAGSEAANCLMNRSLVRMQRHDLDGATSDLDRAVAVYESRGDAAAAAEARHNLGYAALLRGDLVTALALMTTSRPVLATVSDLAVAISDLDRAEVLRDAGLTTEAEELLAQVARQFGAQRMRQAKAEAEFHLARSLLRHAPARAERAAGRAARAFRRLGSDGWTARADAVRLEARLRAHPRTPPSARELARAAEALTARGFHTEAAALRLVMPLAEAEPAVRPAARPDPAAAPSEPEATSPTPHIPEDAPTPLRLRVHEVRAIQAARRGDDRGALDAAAEGLDLLSRWQQSFGALDLRVSAAMYGTDLMFTGLGAASRSDDPAVLFEWSERARHLSQQVTPVRPPRDAAVAADLAELRMLRAELAGGDWTADPRVRRLRNRVRERQWSGTGAAGTRDRVELAGAQASLDDDTAILSFVYTGRTLRCVVVRDTASVIVDLSWRRVRSALDGLRADLDVAAQIRTGPMAAVVERTLTERLERLDAALAAPVRAAASDAQRLVITVPGVLGGIPWAMLPSLADVPFTLGTSVSRWMHDRTASSAGRQAGFVAGPRVPRAPDEVRRAAAAWPGAVVLTGADAGVDATTGLAARVDVLHVAAHGRHAVDNPMFSGLELADGVLFGYDVDLVPRVPGTVVLSACELGRSSVRWGEEALGMTRVWLHAGSRCVIAAPVVVADDVAEELLGALHIGLSAGDPPAVALAAASVVTGLRTPFQCHGSGF